MNIDLSNINLNKENYIIVGVSAGPDSMALLHYLLNNTKTKIVCAHINHNVRKQSIKEQKFLQDFCQKNNIIFEYTKINNYVEKNFEAEARKKRYHFYLKILKKYNAKYLFLAHHGDDLIETILMKIERGSNLTGYAGIKELTLFKENFFIVRPMLNITKKEIINYLKINKIKYFIDKSNKNIKYTRNRYRKYILPFLKKEDPNIHKKYLKFSKTLVEYDDYVKRETIKNITNIYTDNYLNIKKFINLDTFMQKNILYFILNNIYNNETNIVKEKHINNIINIIYSNNPNSYINLPKKLKIIKEYNNLLFSVQDINNANYKELIKDVNVIGNHVIKKINNSSNDTNNICKLNSNELKLPLFIRNRKDGDYIELKKCKKKIKQIFIEEKIPIRKRNNYPLLVDSNDTILWIPNLKKSKFCKKNNEKYDIILRYYEREEKNNE